MSRAIVDPAELRRFAQFLRRANDEMRRQLNMKQGQLHNLSSSWRDQEHEKFVEEFQQQMQAIKSAFARVEDAILKDHSATCVESAIASGDADEQRKKFGELVDLLSKVKS